MAQLDGQLHIDILCPKCGSEMIGLAFDRIKIGESFVWKAYRKCPICSIKGKMERLEYG